MFTMVNIVSNTVLHIWKVSKRVDLKISFYKKKNVTMWWQMLTRLIVVIILQYIQMLNHYVYIWNYYNIIWHLHLRKRNQDQKK